MYSTSTVSRRRPGYSLIEIIVVMSILAIILAIMVPNFQTSRAQRSLDDAARQTETLMSFAHQSAVAGGAISATLPPPALPAGSSQLIAPIRFTVTSAPYSFVLMDGTNYTDGAPNSAGTTLKLYQNSGQTVLAVAYQIPNAAGVLGVATAVPVPVTIVFDPNGAVRKSPTNASMLETVPAIPAGASVTFTFSAPRLTSHVITLDSVSGGITFQ